MKRNANFKFKCPHTRIWYLWWTIFTASCSLKSGDSKNSNYKRYRIEILLTGSWEGPSTSPELQVPIFQMSLIPPLTLKCGTSTWRRRMYCCQGFSLPPPSATSPFPSRQLFSSWTMCVSCAFEASSLNCLWRRSLSACAKQTAAPPRFKQILSSNRFW